MMASNHFDKLKTRARELDEGIDKLSKTWAMPQAWSLVRSTEEPTEDIDSYIDDVWSVLRDTQEGIATLRRELENNNDSDFVSEVIQKAKDEYELLKEESVNLHSVFAEYGYRYPCQQSPFHYESDQRLSDALNANDEDCSDQDFIQETENLTLESTPRPDWELKEDKVKFTPASNGSYKPNTKSLAPPQDISSESHEGNFIVEEDKMYTPGRQRPLEAAYSKHYYSLLKK